MNRRNFLKSVGVACGLAVAAPLKLLPEKKPDIPYGINYWVNGISCKGIRGNRSQWMAYAATYSLNGEENKIQLDRFRNACKRHQFIKPLFI